MAEGTPKKDKRNLQMIAYYEAENKDGTRKHSTLQVQNKFNVTASRIYDVLKAYGIEPKWRKPKKKLR